MVGAKDISAPLSTSHSLQLQDGTTPTDCSQFRSIIGSLQYLSFTCPDICFDVNKLSQFMHKSSQNHWTATKCLLHYLKQTIFHGIQISKTGAPALNTFSDADWAGNLDDRSSTSAYICFLEDTLISWKSNKQRVIARSFKEAEYRALANAASETLWLQILITELGLSFPQPSMLLCDNLGAIQLSFNLVNHARMKHIQIDLHFVRDLVSQGCLQVRHVHTHNQLVDFLTKPLSRQHMRYLCSNICLLDGSSILRRRIKDTANPRNSRESVTYTYVV